MKKFWDIVCNLNKGLAVTLKHFFAPNKHRKVVNIKDANYFVEAQKEGITTIQYPEQKLPIPINGRNQLKVFIDDCIVCDLCAKICPVNCIDIEAIKATGEIGITSDGSKKRLYPANFTIDMGKCMFCGLCTIVCPTECIIMTDEYDRTFLSREHLNYKFSTMTEQEAMQKRKEYEDFMQAKLEAKQKAMDENKPTE